MPQFKEELQGLGGGGNALSKLDEKTKRSILAMMSLPRDRVERLVILRKGE